MKKKAIKKKAVKIQKPTGYAKDQKYKKGPVVNRPSADTRVK